MEERQPMVRLNRNEAIVDMMLYGVGLYKRPCQPIDKSRGEVPPPTPEPATDPYEVDTP